MELKLPKLQSVNLNAKKKMKILLLSADVRMSSGVGTMSREFVMGTLRENLLEPLCRDVENDLRLHGKCASDAESLLLAP